MYIINKDENIRSKRGKKIKKERERDSERKKKSEKGRLRKDINMIFNERQTQ